MDKITVWFIAGFVVLATVVVIAAGVMSGGFSTTPSSSTSTPPGFVATIVPAITSVDHIRGKANAAVSLIEYGDYQCPACSEFEAVLVRALQEYGDRVTFAFRHFPLYTIHQNAGISAQAAEAAGLQGKFWEMHSALYANQAEWSSVPSGEVVAKNFNNYASSIGLDVQKFDKDISSAQVTGKIASDVAGANSAQVDHTPTFFVNLKQIPNPANYNELKAVLDAALGLGNSSSTAQ